MEKVSIYGFGSFFAQKKHCSDIDLLILHESTSYDSCQFSIWCKKYLLTKVTGADITILSKLEESQISFIEKSQARQLGNVYENSAKNDLDAILTREI